MKPILIETPEQMNILLEQLNGAKLIAVDTEFFRETTYYPELALVQVATDSIVACVDPLAFDARAALKSLLLDVDITKIFHSCSQDLEVLFYYLNSTPNSIYDTQIANALLSDHHQIGYASLVENELDVLLDKSQTRTNWLQRPLSKEQVQYAGDDVLYLYQLHEILDKKLRDCGRQSWLSEECDKLSNNENDFQVDIKKLWRRVKGSTKLNRNKLAVVQSIAQWREQLAQLKNKTRRRILGDDIVLQLALDSPENIDTLAQTITHRYKLDNTEQQNLFDTIKSAQQLPEEQWPDNRFNALDSQQKTLLATLQKMVSAKAEELGISSAMICTRKDLEALIACHADEQASTENNNPAIPNIMLGWRLQCIGQTLIDTLTKPDNMV